MSASGVAKARSARRRAQAEAADDVLSHVQDGIKEVA